MTSKLVRNVLMPGAFNNYLIGGNVCNAFAIGNLGAADDFFLVGAEPREESNYPLLTGNVLDSEGQVLFRLVRNLLVVNPGRCSKIQSDRIGYEIHDSSGELILRVATKFEDLPAVGDKCFVTTVVANFYDRQGNLAFRALGGDEDERIESQAKCVFGFIGSFGLVIGFDDDELNVARHVLGSGGAVHRVLTGSIENQEIDLDGTAILKARVHKCKVRVSTGDFVIRGSEISDCEFRFSGAAENLFTLITDLQKGNAFAG